MIISIIAAASLTLLQDASVVRQQGNCEITLRDSAPRLRPCVFASMFDGRRYMLTFAIEEVGSIAFIGIDGPNATVAVSNAVVQSGSPIAVRGSCGASGSNGRQTWLCQIDRSERDFRATIRYIPAN